MTATELAHLASQAAVIGLVAAVVGSVVAAAAVRVAERRRGRHRRGWRWSR